MTTRADTFEIVASLPSHDGKPARVIGRSKDSTQFAVLHQVVGQWEAKAGPWTFATWASCAERVICGDAKALTWPDAQMCLAAGALVFLSGLNGPDKTTSTGGPAAATATAGESLPPRENVLPLAVAEPPRDPRCHIAGCGE